jgi:teichoic acid transport system permease protein
MSMLAATVTVYFRDTTSFLPYLLRIWMYLSPVLLTYEQIVAGVSGVLTPGSGVEPAATTVTLAQRLIYLNPMMGFLRTWEALVNGLLPEAIAVWSATGWSLLALAVGGWFFLTHEREFAFRV